MTEVSSSRIYFRRGVALPAVLDDVTFLEKNDRYVAGDKLDTSKPGWLTATIELEAFSETMSFPVDLISAVVHGKSTGPSIW